MYGRENPNWKLAERVAQGRVGRCRICPSVVPVCFFDLGGKRTGAQKDGRGQGTNRDDDTRGRLHQKLGQFG